MCLTILHVSILVVHILTLAADKYDECFPEIKVRRNTLYNVSLGEDLRISCPLTLCNNSQPTVTWYKLDKRDVLVNVSSGSHVRQEWEPLQHLEGTSFLFFKNILISDSGLYRCQSGDGMGHIITISVNGRTEPTTVTWTTLESGIMTADTFGPYVPCIVGIIVFVIVVSAIYVTPKSVCVYICIHTDLCMRQSRTTADPDSENRVGGSIPGSTVPI
ncbi:hypothetical protein Q8A73_004260 [Channa argus]|nr:hypothetical protein Q8A73_004260 [Channa argus]